MKKESLKDNKEKNSWRLSAEKEKESKSRNNVKKIKQDLKSHMKTYKDE